jgi:pyruvate dehydrogenase E2 component (dihydrolipoamide acetyltransferase)
MSVSVTMPRLGESVSEGTVTRWLKKEGDQVEADEPLLEVSTDKVDTEIPSPAAGVLKSIKVGEDETVEVGSELAVIEDGAGGGGGDTEASGSDSGSSEDQESGDAGDQQDTGDEQPSDDEQTSDDQTDEAPAVADDAQGAQPSGADERQAAAGDDEGEAAASTEERETAAADDDEGEAATDDEGDDGDGGNGPSYVTPLVRRLAAEHGVDLADLHGTGVGGRIRKQDVIDAAGGARKGGSEQPAPKQDAPKQEAPKPETPSKPQAPAAKTDASSTSRPPAGPDTSVRGKTEKLSRLRTVIAHRMLESLQTSAQLTTVVEADLTRIARLRERAKAEFEDREGVKLSYLPFFALATCEALREHPAVNASIDLEAGTATYHDAVHLGIAVDTPRGLLVPVIHDASDLNLAGLARKIADLAERTRGNHITPDELGGGTFTLTNTGSRGALFDTPIINQPQVGILGTGGVVKRAVVVDDPDVGEVIAVRNMAYLALTYDHRMVDGADAARFLMSVKTRLEEGEFESELGV